MKFVEGLAREVVAKRVLLIAFITAGLHLVIALHWLTVAQSDADIKVVTGALDALGTVVAVLYARVAVTPNSSPRDKAGNPLLPVLAPAGFAEVGTGLLGSAGPDLPEWTDQEIADATALDLLGTALGTTAAPPVV